jgi:hypothetical protein
MTASQIVLLAAACLLAANMAAAQSDVCVNNVPVNGRRMQADDSDVVDAALSQPLHGRRLQAEASFGARKVGLTKADWDAWDGTYLKVDFANWEWRGNSGSWAGNSLGRGKMALFKVTTSDNKNYGCQGNVLLVVFNNDQSNLQGHSGNRDDGVDTFMAIQVGAPYFLYTCTST